MSRKFSHKFQGYVRLCFLETWLFIGALGMAHAQAQNCPVDDAFPVTWPVSSLSTHETPHQNAIATDAAGNIWVLARRCDENQGACYDGSYLVVLKYTPQGALVSGFPKTIATDLANPVHASSIAIDNERGNIWVTGRTVSPAPDMTSNNAKAELWKLDMGGNVIGSVDLQLLIGGPLGAATISLDSQGNVLVVSAENWLPDNTRQPLMKVRKYSAAMTPLFQKTYTFPVAEREYIYEPRGVVFDRDGNLWVASNFLNANLTIEGMLWKLNAAGDMMPGFPKSFGTGSTVNTLAFTADSTLWVGGGHDGGFTLWKLFSNGQEARTPVKLAVNEAQFCKNLRIDNHGVLWANGTPGGGSAIWKFDPYGERISKCHYETATFGGEAGAMSLSETDLYSTAILFQTQNNSYRTTVYTFKSSVESFCSLIVTPEIGQHERADGRPFLVSNAAKRNQWYRNGTLIEGAVDDTLSLAETGTYTVRVKAGGCTTATSNAITIDDVCPDLDPPVITESIPESGQPLLVSSEATRNQWLRDNEPIAGATNDSLLVEEEGMYSVMLVDGECEGNPSAAITIVITGTDEVKEDVLLKPNPVREFLLVRSTVNRISIFDLQGKQIPISVNDDGAWTRVSVDGCSPGMFVLAGYLGGKPIRAKFIKE